MKNCCEISVFTLQGSQGINALIKNEVTARISHPLSLVYLQSWLWLGKQKLQTESFIKIKYQLACIICVVFQENYSLIITSNYDMTIDFSWKLFSLYSLSCHQKYYVAKPQYFTVSFSCWKEFEIFLWKLLHLPHTKIIYNDIFTIRNTTFCTPIFTNLFLLSHPGILQSVIFVITSLNKESLTDRDDNSSPWLLYCIIKALWCLHAFSYV